MQQYLLWSGKTHFLGMPFDRLVRMQIDLEVYRTDGFEFPNPLREGDRITAVAMSDSSGWERLISGRDHNEGEMLAEMVREIRARDPDVIEGHNIFRFDLPYMEERARRCGVDLTVGRDGGVLRHRQARFQAGDRVIPYRNYAIHGRHVIDTWFLAQRYSEAGRELRRNGLKDVARHFGVASPDRTYITGAEASWYFDHDPDTLFRYALDDVRETREISAVLSPGYYVQSRIFPSRYQETALADDPTKIDWLMLREYLARRHSIPAPMTRAPVARKYAALNVRGVSRPVVHCDVMALYPAVMLSGDGRPEADELGVFPRLLDGFRELRERPGQWSDAAPAGEDGRFAATVRSGIKVLLDAFHEYLAFPAGRFNDFGAADRVTRAGGELVRRLAAEIEERHGRVVTGGCRRHLLRSPGRACRRPGGGGAGGGGGGGAAVEGRAAAGAMSGDVLLRAGESRASGRAGRTLRERFRFERTRDRALPARVAGGNAQAPAPGTEGRGPGAVRTVS